MAGLGLILVGFALEVLIGFAQWRGIKMADWLFYPGMGVGGLMLVVGVAMVVVPPFRRVPLPRLRHQPRDGQIEFESDGRWWRFLRVGQLGIPIVRVFCKKHRVDYLWRTSEGDTESLGAMHVITRYPGRYAGSLYCSAGQHGDFFKTDPLSYRDAEKAATTVARSKLQG